MGDGRWAASVVGEHRRVLRRPALGHPRVVVGGLQLRRRRHVGAGSVWLSRAPEPRRPPDELRRSIFCKYESDGRRRRLRTLLGWSSRRERKVFCGNERRARECEGGRPPRWAARSAAYRRKLRRPTQEVRATGWGCDEVAARSAELAAPRARLAPTACAIHGGLRARRRRVHLVQPFVAGNLSWSDVVVKCFCVHNRSLDDADAQLPYYEIHYCALPCAPAVMYVLAALWLALLFSLVGSTADEYIVPSLERLSDQLRLSPNVAGVRCSRSATARPSSSRCSRRSRRGTAASPSARSSAAACSSPRSSSAPSR